MKTIDTLLSELEGKVGLPDFDGLAAEVKKLLGSPSVQGNSFAKDWRERLEQAQKDHVLENGSKNRKDEEWAAISMPHVQEDAQRRIVKLSDDLCVLLRAGNVPVAKQILGELQEIALNFPVDNLGKMQNAVDNAELVRKKNESEKVVKLLLPVSNLTATASSGGVPRIVVSWSSDCSGLVEDYQIVRKELLAATHTSPFGCCQASYIDDDVKIGIPYKYVVFPCYDGIIAEQAFSESNVAIASLPIDFVARGEGIGNCAVVAISWTLPPYDKSIQLSLELERIHGDECETIDLTDYMGNYTDENVKVGETYRYVLTLTIEALRDKNGDLVSPGKVLDPVVREVTIRELPPVPAVKALRVIKSGDSSVQVTWKWPEGVDRVEVGNNGDTKITQVSRAEYGEFGCFIDLPAAATMIYAESFCKLGSRYVGGARVKKAVTGSAGIVRWEICRSPEESFVDRLRFWRRREWYVKMTINSRDNAMNRFEIELLQERHGVMQNKGKILSSSTICGKPLYLRLPREAFAPGDRILVKAPADYAVICESLDTMP